MQGGRGVRPISRQQSAEENRSMSENPDAAAAPCCGTTAAAAQADACCDPAAKTEAVAAGVGCCGDTSHASAETDENVAGSGSPTGHLDPSLPVVVVGGGPVGLAAAAQLTERGLDYIVLEAG